MDSKRGQLTLLVIVAIVIVVVLVVYFFISANSSSDPKTSDTSNHLIVKELIENCIEDVAKNSLYENGFQNGYFQLIVKYHRDGSGLYREGYDVPSDFVEDVESYVNRHLSDCLFDASSLNVKVEEIDSAETEVLVADGDVYFYIDYPISISSEGSIILIRDFNFEIKVPVYEIEFGTLEEMGRMADANNFDSRLSSSDLESRYLVVVDGRPERPFVYTFISD